MLDFRIYRRRRIKLVRQSEMAECGLACVAMIANYYGLQVDLATLRRRLAPSLRGATLRSIMTYADYIGLAPRAVKLPLDELKNLAVPSILHWEGNHYVVLERVNRNRAQIHNPDGRSLSIPLDELSKHFTGIALELRPTSDFQPGDYQKRITFRDVWTNSPGLSKAIYQIVVLTLIMQIYTVAMPYYIQLAIDKALPALDNSLLLALMLGFLLFTGFSAIASLLREFIIQRSGTTISFNLSSSIARRLFRLPVDWFERRYTGDILSRFQSIGPIQAFLTQGAVSVIFDGLVAIITLSLMLWYSAILTAVAVATFVIYTLLRWYFFSWERKAQEASIVFSGKEQSALIDTLKGIKTLRLFGEETSRHMFWQNKLVDSLNATVGLSQIRTIQDVANSMMFRAEQVVSIYIAITFVMAGDGFSLGMAFAFFAYKDQFMDKSSAFVEKIVDLKMLELHFERLADIAFTQEDIGFRLKTPQSEDFDLRGRLELKDVTYRYSSTDPQILNRVSFVIEPGDFVAITGPSGGGKSTIVKILSGLCTPEFGEYLVDGRPLSEIGYRIFQSQTAVVLQDDNLFAGTLAENVALFAERIDRDAVIRATRAAAIYEDIMAMPMRFDTLVGDMGSSLSGGQKQRLLLARALYRKPKLLIMDEGTSHLDVEHERMVNESISKLGITRVVVAHRKETIAAARRVIRIEAGTVVMT